MGNKTELDSHTLSFGFSASKASPLKKFRSLTLKAEKGFYFLLTVFGSLCLSIASAYANGYVFLGDKGQWTLASSTGDQVLVVLLNPYLHFIGGVLLLGWGLLGSYLDNDNLKIYNNKLKLQIQPMKKREQELKRENQQNQITHEGKISVLESRLKDSIEQTTLLKSELRAKHALLVKTWLKGAFSHLMNDDDAIVKENTHARVSIYYVYNNHFYILARYSPNAEYDKIHRQKFSMGKGIIYQTYQHLEVHENSLVEYKSSNPDLYYSAIEEKYSYKKEQLENFNMKACRYFGRAIREADVTQGIILIESTKAIDLNSDEQVQKIRDYFEKNWSHLSQFVRHGVKHDITCKHHDSLRTDQDVLGVLSEHSADEDILTMLKPPKDGGQ
ncbi:hypothetical protein A145_04920 [Vibrio splendidus 5S-101]|uniref:hypothetical protein n=1 Tax=Vibrio splendidus TaxID=29497 RepID=UPI0002EC971F|nr:hypothetical protein [Vibrio splendidus]OEF21053.1 hypothetical protein A145_04920 [Vibrio splendidus 5S-101]